MVRSEFAPLRMVVVARSQVRLPDELPPAEVAFLTPEARAMLGGMLGRDHADVHPERQRRWESEREQLCAVFERHGVEVVRTRP